MTFVTFLYVTTCNKVIYNNVGHEKKFDGYWLLKQSNEIFILR